MRRKMVWAAMGVVVLGALMFTSPSQAQITPQACQQVADEVRETGQMLQDEAQAIRQCPSDASHFIFHRAVRLQQGAIAALQAHRCREALYLTMAARRVAARALEVCTVTPPPA